MAVTPIPDLPFNHLTDSDSYKWSHWNQYPPGTTRMMSYFESRGGEFPDSTIFGLQYILHKYLSKPVTLADIHEATEFAKRHGEPFNVDGWMHILDKYDGKLPVKIRAIPEGLVVPTQNALMTIECDDPECFWVVSWLETMLVRVWYPSTIAMASRESKKVLKFYLDLTADNPEDEIHFKLHDFGARGVTCLEQARLGGAAHLLSFLGSDTIEGVRMANHYYHSSMAGYSIPATEHSTVSMWGEKNEYKMFDHYVDTYLHPGEIVACVSDTYDIFKATHAWTKGPLHDKIKASKGTLVIRPDSGDPCEVLGKMFRIMEDNLKDEIIINTKGYKVLPPYLRVIQGDGIDRTSMTQILRFLTAMGWSASNIAFGSGGGLLQKVDRDTQKWAFKCCEAEVNGKTVDVRKFPVTDKGKRSKKGHLDLIKKDGEYVTVNLPCGRHTDSVMRTVFDHGDILVDHDLDSIRKRMAL